MFRMISDYFKTTKKEEKSKEVIPIERLQPTLENPEYKSAKYWDVIICGAGPAGLALARQLSDTTLNVLVIEKLDEKVAAIRPQLVRIDDEIATLFHLTKGGKDVEGFHTKLFLEGNLLNIKDIQRALKNRIDDNKNCSIRYGVNVTAVDMSEGIIILNDKKMEKEYLKFNYLVDATGTQRAIAHLLKGTKDEIKYQPIASRKNPHYLSGYFVLTGHAENSFIFADKTNRIVITMKLPGGDSCFIYGDRASYDKHDHKKAKLYVTSVISEKFYSALNSSEDKEKNKAKGIEYLSHCLQLAFPACNVNFSPPSKNVENDHKKDRLKLQTFTIKRSKAECACKTINNHTIVLIGDACATPDFEIGRGVQDSFLHSKKVKKMITKEVFSGEELITPEKYNQFCDEIITRRNKYLLEDEKQAPETDFLTQILDRITNRELYFPDISQEEEKQLEDLQHLIIFEKKSDSPNQLKIQEKVDSILSLLNEKNTPSTTLFKKPLVTINFLNAIHYLLEMTHQKPTLTQTPR